MDLRALFAGRLIFVTGKGGTGKTTLALALARVIAGQGRRVLLVEIDNQHPSLTEHCGRAPSYEPVEVEPRLAIANITWFEALKEWLGHIVPVRRVVRLILGNRMVRLFLDVTPGSRETVIHARLMQLLKRYDTLVVDLPASGHALSFFRVPCKSAGLFPSGPIRRTLEAAVARLRRPDTHLVMASLPEEMVVNETIETSQALAELGSWLRPSLVVLNQAMAPTLREDESELLGRLRSALESAGSDEARELVRAGFWEADRERDTGEAILRLRQTLDAPLLVAPLMGAGGDPGNRARRVEALLLRTSLRRAGDAR